MESNVLQLEQLIQNCVEVAVVMAFYYNNRRAVDAPDKIRGPIWSSSGATSLYPAAGEYCNMLPLPCYLKKGFRPSSF